MQLMRQIRHKPSPVGLDDRPVLGPEIAAETVWSQADWIRLENETGQKVLQASSEAEARRIAARWGRKVLRSYSTSFFTVTRFLPAAKREDVEMVYAAVRYPDEVVDTFDISSVAKAALLDEWRDHFEDSDSSGGIREAVDNGVPVTVAGFRDVARRTGIPDRYYNSFLRAMRSDISPRTFATWDDLVEGYIYGSATVVGYFLAHIYGTAPGASLAAAMDSARALAIALQLTNFARDVADDSVRGRSYLPDDRTDSEGDNLNEGIFSGDEAAILQGRLMLAHEAARWYGRAKPGIRSFSHDSRIAIEACHRLYSHLNGKILRSQEARNRSSLSVREKLSVLPTRKYWRLPMALVFER